MAVPSLYRRHRPRTFEDVVGQEHVVRTLRNAIARDRVHHAYLFVGSRGTGKTSMAKMLAACLNCEGREESPTTEPCGRCEPCTSIAAATSLDVVEMDAASNNSVDDIRELRDAVAYAPVGGHHKVYILDEAHMLSQAAWNAFLKTLEEPPARTIFVLATTEAARVLPTVADRCHRFDFHRPTPEQLARVLGRVAERESIEIAPAAAALVARHAGGSYRDALGALEQLVTYTGGAVGVDDVLAVLGVSDGEVLLRAFDAIAAGDAAEALRTADAAARTGRDLAQVLRDVEGHARALMVVCTLGALPEELRLSPERDRRTEEQAGRVGVATVVRSLDLVALALRAVRDGADARTQLELVLLRAATPEVDPEARALTARLERLERRMASGGGPAPATVAAGAPRGAGAPPAAGPDRERPTAAGAPAEPGASAGALGPSDGPDQGRRADAGPDDGGAAAAAVPAAPGAMPAPAPAMVPAADPPAAADPPLVADPPPAADRPPGASPPAVPDPRGGAVTASASASASAAAVAPPTSATASPAAFDVTLVRDVLPAVRDRLAHRPIVCEALRVARAAEVRDGDRIVLAVPAGSGYAVESLREGSGREAVLDALADLLGTRPRLEVEVGDAPAAAAAPLPEDEAVRRVITDFDAREVDAPAPAATDPHPEREGP